MLAAAATGRARKQMLVGIMLKTNPKYALECLAALATDRARKQMLVDGLRTNPKYALECSAGRYRFRF